jgi:PTH1 family peptidyl-tRNA hydrolase
MKIIVGLGNSGQEYENTRHNAGFMLVDKLAHDAGAVWQFNKRFKADIAESRGVFFVKPQTFMNLSGQAVAALMRFYKIPLDKVLVAHDDIDLPLGTIRIRPGGGSGGQKGLASTIEKLGTQDFPRMRIGIGRPSGSQEAAGYVLQEFSNSDEKVLQDVLPQAVEAIKVFVADGLEAAMTRYNGNITKE